MEYIPITIASQIHNIPVSDLVRLAESGKIGKARESNGALLVNNDDLSHLPKHERPEYLKFSHLAGNPISISDSSRKYHVATSTLTQWMQRGFIAQLGRDGKKTMLDEADVAYCVEIRNRFPGAGRWLFNKDGTPRQQK